MIYEILFTNTALESIKKIDKEIRNRLISKIEWLSQNMDLIRPTRLKGKFSNLYKLRVGNYRIIYDVDYDNLQIVIHFVGHRKEIYKID